MTKHQCLICHAQGFTTPTCPDCGSDSVVPMCVKDHLCTCPEDVHSGIRYCPVCGAMMCPCGCHDVSGVSRVTGLKEKLCAFLHGNLSDVDGWNNGKKAELRDRHRYTGRELE